MRLKPCDKATARARLEVAETYMYNAEVSHELDDGEHHYHANTLITGYVHAGIGASDAICCHVLGEHSEGSDHADAARVIGRVPIDGKELAKALTILLALKTKAGYGAKPLPMHEVLRAQRSADKLMRAARDRINR